MPRFETAKGDYRTARDAASRLESELIAERERAKRLAREEDQLRRTADQRRRRGPLADIIRERTAAEARVGELREELLGARESRFGALSEFADLADPTEAVSHWPADIPIALMPLRLETRYRRTNAGRQLMVRVFPDDILVDSFQPEMSRAEFDNVVIYWTQRWRAGGKEEGRRAAWMALAKAHGPGRAQWLTDEVAPLNPSDEPVRGDNDYVLVIRPDSPVAETEQPFIGKFWTRVWTSAGAERDVAFADLVDDVGSTRATEIEATLTPVNLFDPDVKSRGSLIPRVVFLHLPGSTSMALSEADWTRAAHAWLLPERFVLIGYRDGSQVFRQIGQPVPSELQIGPDPSAGEDDQITADKPDLGIPEGMRWMVDFDEAKSKGMGFVVDLGDGPGHFDRLFVLGLRLSSDATEAAVEVDRLISNHQRSRKGFTLLPQGRTTNNTDETSAGYSWWEDPAEAYEHFHPVSPHEDPQEWAKRRDGAWLAGALGLDSAVLRNSPGYFGTDQAEARAMNIALWPATLGYYMEQLMEPVFPETAVSLTRDYFGRFVLGCGSLPLFRVGRQPYGIVPASAWSRASWWRDPSYARTAAVMGLPPADYLNEFHALSERATSLWRTFAASVSQAGVPSADAHQQLLDIIGLHPASVEFYQRYSQTFTQYYNLLGFERDPVSAPITAEGRRYILAGLETLAELGWTLAPDADVPELLEKIFLRRPNQLKGDLVAAELSEAERLPITRADSLNYIEWLQKASRTSHDMLRKQEGFGAAPPTELLYLMLHHALDLGFIEGDLQLRRERLQMSDIDYRVARKEPKMLAVADERAAPASRWTPLYRTEPAITGDSVTKMGEFVPQAAAGSGLYLDRQIEALETLKTATSARLERAFVEHLDTLSYRLDAWRMGLQGVQLSYIRGESEEGFQGNGLHVGAFGWVENLSPRPDSREPVVLDEELVALFDEPDGQPLTRDATNQGHIHAPSLDQAVTAAILRSGHVAHATASEPDLLAVDLSSERVRLAQRLIEGMRNGQSLGALLGYRLERALHDEPNLFLDRLIYDLRRAFPLVGNRNQTTSVPDVDAINKVEARNVLNGADFADHIDSKDITTYPYGLDGLPSLSKFTGPGLPSEAEIGTIIDLHVADMRSLADAFADLGIAEGVFQMVRGNPDRAAGVLDAFSKGGHPPEIEVSKTPRSGRTITHRLAVHLPGGIPAGVAGRPRVVGEPALAGWLAKHLPDPAKIFARVMWKGGSGHKGLLTPSMADLGLVAADLFYMLDSGSANDMAGFDDLLIDHAEQNGAKAHHDARFELEYKPAGVSGLTLFEVAPLVRSLRGVLLGARPLRPSDFALAEEAAPTQDSGLVLRADKVQAVRGLLNGTAGPVGAFVATLESAIGEGVDPTAALNAAAANIDSWLETYATLVRTVAPFELKAASLTAGVEGRRAPFEKMHDALREVAERWTRLESEYDAVMAKYTALAGSEVDAKSALLLRAAGIISTKVITPIPTTLTALEGEVKTLKDEFDLRRTELDGLSTSNRTVGTLLSAIGAFVSKIADVESTPFDLQSLRFSILALAKDLHRRSQQLKDDVEGRVAKADAALGDAGSASGEKAQALILDAGRALLGPSFVVLPEFQLADPARAEWSKSWNDRSELLNHLTSEPDAPPYPLDDWVHGLARVRERLRHFELAQLLAPVLGANEGIAIEALQFPYRADDVWVGMKLPKTFRNGEAFKLEGDKLLYTAHFGGGAEIDSVDPTKTYCGLLVDEWVEVVPATHETTGLAFHFDRPSNEAPQGILLVTSPALRGSWAFQDIIDAMHETLDMARLRAVEPAHIDASKLGPLLPAVLSAVTTYPITAMLNFAFNNNLQLALLEADGE